MKKIYIPILAAFLGIFVSCDDFLDTPPDNRAEINTKEKVRKLLTSAYPTASPAYMLEMASDNTDYNEGNWTDDGRFQEQIYSWKDITESSNDSPTRLWEKCYLAIASSNYALNAIEEMGNPSDMDGMKAEALLTRAFNHYLLVTTFSKIYGNTSNTDLGITYMTEAETTVKPEYNRGTAAETYAKIYKDIEDALPLVDDNIYDIPKYHFNKKAAYAFAARFCLYYQKFDKTIEYATKALGNNPASGLRDWAANQEYPYFEDVRGNVYIGKENRANYMLLSTVSSWAVVGGKYTRGAKYTHNKLIAENETTGSAGPWGVYSKYKFRHTQFVSPKVVLCKFNGYFEYTDPVAQTGYYHLVYPVFTSDETLLCRAEAYALSNQYENALQDVNTFVQNYVNTPPILTKASIDAFYSNLKYYTPDKPTAKKELNPDFAIPAGSENLIHAILHLRRIETIHEGLRWMDVNRYGIKIYRRKIAEDGNTVTVTDTMEKSDPRRAIQIPYDAIDAGLEPNPRIKEDIDRNIINEALWND